VLLLCGAVVAVAPLLVQLYPVLALFGAVAVGWAAMARGSCWHWHDNG